MHLKADVINQYKPINERFINTLLKEEITLNPKKIIVLDDGEIAGCGTHEELLKNCDVYREIALSQLSQTELEAI